MIYITGDTHGLIDFDKLQMLCNRGLSKDDVVIILGDCGICWDIFTFDEYVEKYNKLKCKIIFIDGNHENFTMLNKLPIIQLYGALMHKINNHIFHVLRGEIMTINDITFLCIGGAVSIDKMYRYPYISYWPEEEISVLDISNAKNNLTKEGYKVDYVLTHCVDSYSVKKYFNYKTDCCTDMLSFISKEVTYKYWLFGHYHKDEKLTNKKRVFYNDIAIIEKDKYTII